MAVAYVIKEKCPQNHACPALPHCPTQAIVQEGYQAPRVIAEKCIACGNRRKL
ncbi:MAG: hypothetical protein H6Q70_3041 [Firmicutes bacterium]|nr:hypothetical protein [Bacillota bacterium]